MCYNGTSMAGTVETPSLGWWLRMTRIFLIILTPTASLCPPALPMRVSWKGTHLLPHTSPPPHTTPMLESISHAMAKLVLAAGKYSTVLYAVMLASQYSICYCYMDSKGIRVIFLFIMTKVHRFPSQKYDLKHCM